MRLAQANPAIQEQRIVGPAGRLGHPQRGGAGQVIAVPNDKGVEAVPGIETQLYGTNRFLCSVQTLFGGYLHVAFSRNLWMRALFLLSTRSDLELQAQHQSEYDFLRRLRIWVPYHSSVWLALFIPSSGRSAFLLPFLEPLRTVFDPPIHLRQFKSDVVSRLFRFKPLMPQDFLVLGL
jgi:hypothetical protein